MGMLWVVFFVALTGSHFGYGLPIGPTPQTYPYDGNGAVSYEAWDQGGLYAAVPVLALITMVGLLLGCTWCYRHKDCKPNQGEDNQLFTGSVTQHLHEARRSNPPDSDFSEPVNNNISEDNNNGPISLREMQNIANNNAAAYIVSENEERNRVSRESVVEFEPLPTGIRVADPLERHADWFGGEDFSRNRLQYLREIGRGWFGRVVEGEIEERGASRTVAVKILNQNASLEDKARFLEEARLYRDVNHESVLAFIAKCLQEDPWILIFELCPMDLQQYLIVNRHKMASLNESGVPLRLMCDISSALAHLHSRGYLYGCVWSGSVSVRGAGEDARAALGAYASAQPPYDARPPEQRHTHTHTASTDVWSLGTLVWQVCTWGMMPSHHPPPLPDLPCPYRNHLYQVMQLCWNPRPEARPTSAQVHALINHLHSTQTGGAPDADHGSDFEERWQRLKPNSIPIIDEHVAIVHAPSTSEHEHFTPSDQEYDNPPTIQDSLSVDMDTAVSRSSSIMSDKDPLSVQIKSESLTNLHGSLEDVRNIYLTHNEMAVLECHQGNISLDDRERENDRSDSSVDPWLKDIIAGSQDDVSYYKDVSDVIKNLDNILNSEKTSSSESSHQASPSRDNLSLDCKKDYPLQSNMVKSPGISNFQNILESGLAAKAPELETCEEDDIDRDTIGTLSHSFERHSDSISQQTLENITPETPIKDLDVGFNIEEQNESSVNQDLETSDKVSEIEQDTTLPVNTELPNEHKIVNSDSKIPKLKVLCVASIPSVSETNIELSNGTQDCIRSCDNNLAEERTENETETKSIDDVVKDNADSSPVLRSTIPDATMKCETQELHNIDLILPEAEIKIITMATSSMPDDLYSIPSEVVSKEDVVPMSEYAKTSDNLELKDKNKEKVISDLILPVETITESLKESGVEADITKNTGEDVTKTANIIEVISIDHAIAPELVQNIVHSDENTHIIPNKETEDKLTSSLEEALATSPISPEKVQTTDNEICVHDEVRHQFTELPEKSESPRSEHKKIEEKNIAEQSNDSTVYMDLINTTSNTAKEETIDENMKEVIKSCLDMSTADSTCTLVKNESTVYMDLPSTIKETDNFLQSERTVSSQNDNFTNICSSTPIGSDHSTENTLENSVKIVNEAEVLCESCDLKPDESEVLSETKLPYYGPGVTLTKLEQRYVPENMSPFESPTKSHHTDTYDENSSVVLGPFENCTLELFKGVKSIDAVDLPKEELLAFSSNFSEINLETPSPLRDGNFLNEVPDIIHDEILQFDDLEDVSERVDNSGAQTEESNETDKSATEKRVSPLTPPNSPGNFLASTSQQKYSVVDIDLDSMGPPEEDSDLPKEVDLNQIELQITTKLAMAENENNLNIEYSGPLTVEGVVLDETMLLHESVEDTDVVEDSFLAGNGGSSPRANVELDEECVKALRDELELKLPLAQVANIEPESCGAEWGGSLPPPPELILSYPGALSPIAEETRQQLSAYENDANWNTSTRTDSSESYPEPCNNSTDEVTDLPTGLPSALERDNDTYTLHSRRSPEHSPEHSPDHTYTLQKDANTSKEVTMSADSLNASPYKKPLNGSPIDDTTYNKNEKEESRCERISQVSPFILSPTTDSSAPESDLADNATGVSTLSKTTVPTDAKSTKPSETQCLSKATSIDSWCSNDTLYNVEENFDDLAMDPELPLEFEPKEGDSESTDTLTHHDDDKELSHCSTYIVHDSKSEPCETFSPDSITANDNYTYTKARTEAATATPSVLTKSELDSTKNTQTKDLAYGTLMSGLPSYSNCTTEVASGFDDVWRMQQPELVRRSPITDEINVTPPKFLENKETVVCDSPRLPALPAIKKMDSVEISCLHDNTPESQSKFESPENRNMVAEMTESPSHYVNMAPSVTSTPFTEPLTEGDNVVPIPLLLPDVNVTSPDFPVTNIPNFQTFSQSAEVRPQDISPYNGRSCSEDTEVLLEGDSATLSKISNRDGLGVTDHTPNYSDFENSAITKPQEVHSRDRSSQSLDIGVSSDEFQNFESSVRRRPQDLSSVIDASSLLLNSERMFSESALGNSNSLRQEQTSQSESRVNNFEPMKSLDVSPPNDTNLIESQEVGKIETPSTDYEEETEQPHSIIMTERDVLKENPNRTYDSHTDGVLVDLNYTYDSHASRLPLDNNENDSHCRNLVHVNGIDKKEDDFDGRSKSPKVDDLLGLFDAKTSNEEVRESVIVMPAIVTEASPNKSDRSLIKSIEEIKCNGNSEKYATVEFLNETFEELIESNVDDGDCKDFKTEDLEEVANSEIKAPESSEPTVSPVKEEQEISKEMSPSLVELENEKQEVKTNGVQETEEKLTSVTDNFLQNEKKFCQSDAYFPLLSDIRFTGPATEIMSTSFTQDSPTEPISPECERDGKTDAAADILKEWDSDSDSHSTNSSSGEFIWKDGDGHETPLVPSTHFQHQRGSGGHTNGGGAEHAEGESGGASDGSGDSGSGSEGDEVEFVPSSWDCRAAPAKSSLRSLEATPENKKRVVFKRQKYHCVYEYPREVAAVDASPAAYVPDLSTYSDWDPSSAEEAELGYGQLFGAPSALDLYPLRAGIAYDYDEDFFISSSARPFESLGIMSTTSQFFPGMYVKGSLEQDLPLDAPDEFPPPPEPLPTPTLVQTRTPSLDFTTPDSGVDDITPGSTSADDDFKAKKLPETELAQCWRPVDSASSSESVSPSSPGGEALGGLRHTRDKLKLDLPPSPHIPSPRHNRVFNFVLDKPKRHRVPDEKTAEGTTPLVMTDETPVVTTSLPLQKDCEDLPLPEPTFSTFGKTLQRTEPERSGIILTDEAQEERQASREPESKAESPKLVEGVKGEGTVLDSGDEDSGIESSSKATLERNKTTPNVS